MLQLRAGKKLQPAKNGLQDESSTLLVSYSSAFREAAEPSGTKGIPGPGRRNPLYRSLES